MVNNTLLSIYSLPDIKRKKMTTFIMYLWCQACAKYIIYYFICLVQYEIALLAPIFWMGEQNLSEAT